MPLDARFADSPDMKQLMVAYQGQLEQLGFAGLGIREKRTPAHQGRGRPDRAIHRLGQVRRVPQDGLRHLEQNEARLGHDTAGQSHAATAFDPECLSCHVTGWSPQEFLPYASGFMSIAETPLLEGNGCENCHGPGGGHVAAEAGKDLVLRGQLREAMSYRRPRPKTSSVPSATTTTTAPSSTSIRGGRRSSTRASDDARGREASTTAQTAIQASPHEQQRSAIKTSAKADGSGTAVAPVGALVAS